MFAPMYPAFTCCILLLVRQPQISLPQLCSTLNKVGEWGLSGGPGHCWARLGQAEMLNTQRSRTDPAPLAQDRLIPKG